MSETRKGEVTFQGNPLELVGPKLKVGDAAPEFTCVGKDLSLVRLADTPGKVRLFNVVPSLDTPVCQIQTKTFSGRFNDLGDQVAAYTVSIDTPFAQGRFNSAESIANVVSLSDMHDRSFGTNYGVLVHGLPIPLLARSVFVLDANGTIQYVEIVPEIANEPNYDEALAAIAKLTS